MRQPGRAVVLIKFPRRDNHDRQLEAYHASLQEQTHCSCLATVRATIWVKQPTVRWFTMIDADDTLIAKAGRIAHALSGIRRCKCDIICATRTGDPAASEAPVPKHRSLRKHQSGILSAAGREGRTMSQTCVPSVGIHSRAEGSTESTPIGVPSTKRLCRTPMRGRL